MSATSSNKSASILFDLINRSFSFQQSEVKIVMCEEKPWFCGKDVAKILGYSNTNKALSDYVRDKNKLTFEKLNEDTDMTGIYPNLKNSLYINEPGLYELIMKNKLTIAQQFQDWIFEEVLPNIRKFSQEKYLKQLEEAKQRNVENIRKIALLERQNIILDSYIKNMKSLDKNQMFYLVTTAAYAAQCRFEFGGVKDAKELRSRISGYNTGRSDGDLMYVSYIIKCNNYKLIENHLRIILRRFKDKSETRKDVIRLRYDFLIEIVELVCSNFDREVDFFNKKCQEYFQNTIYTEPIIPEPIDISD